MCVLEFGKYLMYSFVVLCIIRLFPSTKGDDCNEVVCASIVSKCLLIQKCQCKLSDCYCCKDCINCLGDLYTECCSCLDMCPKHNDSLTSLAPKSQIGDFEGVPEIFEILTADENAEKWTTISFPMRKSAHLQYNMPVGTTDIGNDVDQLALVHKNIPDTVNCTVVYWNTCQTNKKCSKFCESMGAKSYRWFHDGCCECVGANCYNYGINESRCSACPDDEEEDINSENEDDDDADYAGENEDGTSWDYGEDEINYN